MIWPTETPGVFFRRPLVGLLLLGEAADVVCGGLQGDAEGLWDAVPGGVHLFASDAKVLMFLQAIEFCGELKQSLIAVLVQAVHDLADDGFDLSGFGGAALFEVTQQGFGLFCVLTLGLDDLHGSLFFP